MEKIKMGSLCYTKYDKKFEYHDNECIVKKGNIVLVCDVFASEDYALVEIEDYDTVFDYKIDDLLLIKN